MKKIISLSLLMLSLAIFFGLYDYVKKMFDYHVAQNLGYVFYWSASLFILSLPAFFLEEKKYKNWLYFTFAWIVFSLFIAVRIGDGNGMILSFDGQLLTWIFLVIHSFASLVYFIVQFVKSRR